MAGQASEAWRVRLSSGPQEPSAGNGFIFATSRALTCAHVLTDSSSPLWLWRYGHPAVPIRALDVSRVDAWLDDDRYADLAVARLPKEVTEEVAPLGAEARPLEGTEVRVFGFAETSAELGEWADGVVGRSDASGAWLQVTSAPNSGIPITQGFSGSAAVDKVTGLVVGMITWAAPLDSPSRNSWLIPLDTIAMHVLGFREAFSPAYLADHSFVRGRQALEERKYDQAAHIFAGLTRQYDLAELYFYCALASLRGKSPNKLTLSAVSYVDELLRLAWERDYGSPAVAALWALVKEDYFRLRGRRVGPPSIEQLSKKLNGISREQAAEIVEHVPARESVTWRVLGHISGARD